MQVLKLGLQKTGWLLHQLCSHLVDLDLCDLGHLFDGALPTFTFFILTFFGLHIEQEIGFVFFLVLDSEHGEQVVHEVKLRLDGVDVLVLHNFGESVSHDGDEHV